MQTKSKIVTSAADGCGNPSSIRSMDHLPSRDHKGAEYKESFMFSNRASVSHGYSLAVAALAIAACIGLASTASATDETIYADNFTGSATTQLAGQAPTTDSGGATWTAATPSSSVQWMANGTVVNPAPGVNNIAVSLPLTPVNGGIYTASIVLDPTANGNQIFFGFSTFTGPNAAFPFYNGVGPWMDLADTDGISTFAGPATSNQTSGAALFASKIPGTATIVLNTTAPDWTVQWSYSENADGPSLGSYTYTGAGGANPNPTGITGIGFASNSETGSVSDFSLTGPPVPEPAMLGLVVVGTAGVLLLISRKRMAHRNV